MRRLIATWGLPGSGKSTWAAEEKARLEAHNLKVSIVCKDDIREALVKTGWTWSKENEQRVIKLRNEAIRGAFAQGVDVVISADTNFGKHLQTLRGMAQGQEAEFEVKDFTKVPLEECIRRDAAREKPVGANVIKEMYYKYLNLPETVPYVPDPEKPEVIICDIDGTVALAYKRSPYDYSKVSQDKVNEPVADIVRSLVNLGGYQVVYCSGREEVCRAETVKWLDDNRLPAGPLFMRKAGDHRKDFIVKQELFDNYIRNEYNVQFVLDDRTQVVNMWRRLGLTCLQVAEGNF